MAIRDRCRHRVPTGEQTNSGTHEDGFSSSSRDHNRGEGSRHLQVALRLPGLQSSRRHRTGLPAVVTSVVGRGILPVFVGLLLAEDEAEVQDSREEPQEVGSQDLHLQDVALVDLKDGFLLGVEVAAGAVHPATLLPELVEASLAKLLWPLLKGRRLGMMACCRPRFRHHPLPKAWETRDALPWDPRSADGAAGVV